MTERGSEQIVHAATLQCSTSSRATACWHHRRHIPISWVWVLSCLEQEIKRLRVNQNTCCVVFRLVVSGHWASKVPVTLEAQDTCSRQQPSPHSISKGFELQKAWVKDKISCNPLNYPTGNRKKRPEKAQSFSPWRNCTRIRIC